MRGVTGFHARQLWLAVALIFAACESPSYVYRYVPGKTATLAGDYAIAPQAAPPTVMQAVAAANRIAGSNYARGGGHRGELDGPFDCSGATSYVLRAAGLLEDSMPSSGFRRYGGKGEGEWISVYARRGHVFLVLAGLRFDTAWHDNGNGERGPRWTMRSRPADGAVVRHPPGL